MRKRSIVIIIYIMSAVSVCFSFTSCGGGAYNKLLSMLGFDMNDYGSEPVIKELGEDDEAYAEIVKIIGMLTLDSANITPFETPREAASGNRDAILNYMLNTGYASYSGNSALLEEASAEYPQYNITTLIPEGDFESTVYRYFGGDASVVHESSVRFTHLPRVSAYTTTGQPVPSTVSVTITECCETEHTYRTAFTLTDESGASFDYTSMIMKREDETMYMRYVRAASDASDET